MAITEPASPASMVHFALPTQCGSVRTVRDVVGLSAVFDDGVNVVALNRPLDAGILEDARRALSRPFFHVQVRVAPSEPGSAFGPQLADLPHLAADIRFWVEVLADLTGCEQVGVRLARLEAAMCPRFHVDKVVVRVVSTFLGAGTEYLADEDIDRRRLGHAALGASDEASGLLRNGARLRHAEPGAVILLKGEAWPNNTGRGAVHRSPRCSTDSPRLVMTLDPLD